MGGVLRGHNDMMMIIVRADESIKGLQEYEERTGQEHSMLKKEKVRLNRTMITKEDRR